MRPSAAITVSREGIGWNVSGEVNKFHPTKAAAVHHALDEARRLTSSGIRAQVYVRHEPFVLTPDPPDGEGLTSRAVESEQGVARV